MGHRRRITKIALAGLTLSLLAIFSYVDSPTAHAAPSLLTMTGFILPAEYADTPGAYTLRFRDQSWIFNLTDVGVLSGYEQTRGAPLLDAPGLRAIRLVGDEEIADLLRTRELSCRGVRIEGYFYESQGALFFASIENAPKEGRYEKCN